MEAETSQNSAKIIALQRIKQAAETISSNGVVAGSHDVMALQDQIIKLSPNKVKSMLAKEALKRLGIKRNYANKILFISNLDRAIVILRVSTLLLASYEKGGDNQ